MPDPYPTPKRSARHPPARRAPGFTLVELLVVITIIVILIALLTPALDRAMASAVRLNCQTRMRALNLAVRMYTLDHKQWLPEWLDANVGVPSFWWYRLHANAYVRDGDFDGLFSPGPRTYKSPFACPERAINAEGFNTALLPEWIAYNVFLGFANANSDGSGWEDYRHVKITKVERPDQTFMYTDSHRYPIDYPNADTFGIRADYVLIVAEPGLSHPNMIKHEGGSNWVFVDGHIEYLPKAEAIHRGNLGETGAAGETEYFVLPFPNQRLRKP